jgi:hypothetical protein
MCLEGVFQQQQQLVQAHAKGRKPSVLKLPAFWLAIRFLLYVMQLM